MGVKLSSGTPPIVPRMPDIDFIRDIFLQIKILQFAINKRKGNKLLQITSYESDFFIANLLIY